jgi:hypothetical protein
MESLLLVLLRILQYVSLVYMSVRSVFVAPQIFDTARPSKQYFLGDSSDDPSTFTRVPEDEVYVEEWIQGETRRYVVKYEGEDIPTSWPVTPFDRNPKTPWVWVGDRDTEIDLTRTFNKYLAVGNVITLDLVLKLIKITERTELIYIESGTFKELKFPGNGITIEEYVD